MPSVNVAENALNAILWVEGNRSSLDTLRNYPSVTFNGYVIAYNAPAEILAYGALLQAKGMRVRVCDGVNDHVEINELLAFGGLVHLSKGLFKPALEISLGVNNTILEGEGYDTNIEVTGTYDDSICIEAGVYNAIIRDLSVNGGLTSKRIHVLGNECTLDHVYSYYHTEQNILMETGSQFILIHPRIFGKPIKCTQSALTVLGGYFNGLGVDPCIQFEGHSCTLLGILCETYAGGAILVAQAATVRGFNLIGGRFESAYTSTNLITLGSASHACETGQIRGVYEGTDALVTNFVTIYGAVDFAIENNYSLKNIYIGDGTQGAIASGCTGIEVNSLSANIKYNNQNITYYLKNYYDGYSFYRDSAAPVTGVWRVGDRVENNTPVSGQTTGWRCTTAPATWKAEANLT